MGRFTDGREERASTYRTATGACSMLTRVSANVGRPRLPVRDETPRRRPAKRDDERSMCQAADGVGCDWSFSES